MKRHAALVVLALFVTSAVATEKKIVEYGWDLPMPEYVRANIRDMEQKPFDGVIFRLHGGGDVLDHRPWPEDRYNKDFDDVANIAWEKFTDNFVIMWAASDQDWFDDTHWTEIEKHAKAIAKAARLAKCVGLVFDPEPYGTSPWDYSKAPKKDTKSFAEYSAKVRERGGQFIRALESEFPSPIILSFYQLALFDQFCSPMSEEDRTSKLAGHDYALYPSFFLGMLEASSPSTVFIDGNENAYYYYDSAPYFEAYHRITQHVLPLVDPPLRDRYRAQVRVGQALYVDQYFALRPMKILGDYMTPEEQPKWFEHNVYYALYTSDKYVWCYSERMNWWTNENVPETAADAVRSGAEKVRAGQPLGFDFKPIADAANRRKNGEV